MIGYIYKITNPKNRIYIGQTISPDHRIWAYNSNNCKKQIKLYNSINKYGWKSHKFEIIKICLLEDLNNAERYFQDSFNILSKMGLNCRLTATDDKSGKMSKESIIKRELKRKFNNKKISEETRLKMSLTRTGLKYKSKELIDINTNIVYKSIREAADAYNINSQTLTNMLNGRQKNKYLFLKKLPPS